MRQARRVVDVESFDVAERQRQPDPCDEPVQDDPGSQERQREKRRPPGEAHGRGFRR